MIAVRRTGRVALAIASLVVAHAAQGGLLDSPPPTFGTVAGKIVFRMGPIHFQPDRTDTVITCTNVSDAAARVAVEVFDERDRAVGNRTDTTLPASGTVNFVTSDDASRQNWLVIEGLAPLDHGKARVSATTEKLSCSAYHRIREADGGVREQPLELIKKLSAAQR
jgi:hypothetical protein